MTAPTLPPWIDILPVPVKVTKVSKPKPSTNRTMIRSDGDVHILLRDPDKGE